MLIAFAAEQKLDEGSGGVHQTLWLQPRFSPTIPAPHSHCSAHPAFPPPCQLRPGTEGRGRNTERGEKREGKESFLKVFTGYCDSSKKQPVLVTAISWGTLQHLCTCKYGYLMQLRKLNQAAFHRKNRHRKCNLWETLCWQIGLFRDKIFMFFNNNFCFKKPIVSYCWWSDLGNE